MFDYDYLIIGSGFGGSASALRLAEKGWNVAVVEQGRRIGEKEIDAGKRSMFKLIWMPALGLRGYFVQHVIRHAAIVGGCIVWSAVMLDFPGLTRATGDRTIAGLKRDHAISGAAS